MTEPICEDVGILQEWDSNSRVLQQIPLKVSRGIFSRNLNLTCVDVVHEYLALGTNCGLIYWYCRTKNELQRLRLENTNNTVTRVKIVSTVDYMVAAGTDLGNITIFQIPKPLPHSHSNDTRQKKNQVERFTIDGLHTAPVTSIEWSKNGMRLFSGDKNGLVVLTEIDFYMHLSKSTELLNEQFEIVQLSYNQQILLISTTFRSIICDGLDKWKVHQVGTKERKTLGKFGATFCNLENGLAIYACRPGHRLWLATGNGLVQKTLLFRSAVSSSYPRIQLINPVSKTKSCNYNFGKLTQFGSNKLIAYNSEVMYVLHPKTISILSSLDSARGIIDLAVNEDEIFILEEERSLLRIAYGPDKYCSEPGVEEKRRKSFIFDEFASKIKDTAMESLKKIAFELAITPDQTPPGSPPVLADEALNLPPIVSLPQGCISFIVPEENVEIHFSVDVNEIPTFDRTASVTAVELRNEEKVAKGKECEEAISRPLRRRNPKKSKIYCGIQGSQEPESDTTSTISDERLLWGIGNESSLSEESRISCSQSQSSFSILQDIPMILGAGQSKKNRSDTLSNDALRGNDDKSQISLDTCESVSEELGLTPERFTEEQEKTFFRLANQDLSLLESYNSEKTDNMSISLNITPSSSVSSRISDHVQSNSEISGNVSLISESKTESPQSTNNSLNELPLPKHLCFSASGKNEYSASNTSSSCEDSRQLPDKTPFNRPNTPHSSLHGQSFDTFAYNPVDTDLDVNKQTAELDSAQVHSKEEIPEASEQRAMEKGVVMEEVPVKSLNFEAQGASELPEIYEFQDPGGNEEPFTQFFEVTKFIRIGIADKNDNPPYFDKALYEAEVDENEDIQHTVLTVTAKDHDESSRIRYEITSGNIGGAFAVKNMTGAIYVAGALDYETRKRYELRLAASDNLKENYTTVVIHVKDVNDNPPVFERPTYRTQITEEDDRNLPKRVLQYSLRLSASDSLSENYTTIIIHVNDVNDLPPVFSSTVYSATLEEEHQGPYPVKLLQVTATDGDKDRHQNIVYFLTGQGIDPDNPANSKFDINRTTGEIFVLKPLDRDQPNGRPQWRFTVFAQDEGGEGLVGYADVQVNLKDINDNAPIFPQGVYFGNVTENGTAGMVVMTMTAVDYDDPSEGTNARLIYSIEKNVIEEETGSPIFEIESETGVIKTAVCCLDRERTPDYSIQVVAMDGGGLKGTGTASIRVKDINDMPPMFTKDEWFTEVDETAGVSLPEIPILTVTVHDEDETNKFQYKVIENSGYGADKFTMVRNNDGTGSLKIVQPLDYEDQLQSNGFRFRIQVNDKGEDNDNDKYHVAYSWVVVKLRDINDNKPLFERPNIEVSVYENAEVGKSLETFKATDPDQGGKSKVSYAIDRTSDRKRQFSINQSGTVTIQRNLDREETPRHQVKILAIDDGIPPKTATATLTVIVQDINDNAPRFHKEYRPVLPEHVPPRKVVEVLATDDDDRSKSNGPPFIFRLDPNADDVIRASFKVEHDQKGANGDGMAVVSSLRSFDREQQKEYLIPIVIKDSGNPAMSGTSTLTVVIGDVNDNKMQPGSKEILVYNYMGQAPDTEIGRVYVYDLDDWDLPDKKFYWETNEGHPRFKLNEDTGMLTMRHGTKDGKYHLRFKVYDRKHTQTDIPANVTVTVREISNEAVLNSGSVRLAGITDEDFIRVWNYKKQSVDRSMIDKFKEKLADLLNIEKENVDVFSVQLRRKHPPLTDVRFSAHGSPYYKPVKLNGIVLIHREEIEKDVGINITMVGIDECLYENQACEGSCTNTLDINNLPYTVNANKTALVGVRVDVIAECTCGARNFSKGESCKSSPCYNGGRCVEGRYGLSCSCPGGYNGPRCQQTSRSFRGSGWAWYPPLDMCDNSHLSLEFVTRKPEGLLLYNGPIVAPEPEEILVSDFISLELERGQPRLLINFGSGTLELRVKTKKSLDDGEWHRIDIFWDTENVKLIVDFCKSADISEMEDGSTPEIDLTSCQAQGTVPLFNEYLNVNAPLQIGGLHMETLDPIQLHWQHMPIGKGFDGCIKNVIHNSKLYDLAHPGLSKNSMAGCPQTEEVCANSESLSRCWEHGTCTGSLTEARCQCHPGWTGPACFTPTIPTTFAKQSYVKYALSFEPDRFSTQIQLRFRTRDEHGELFRVSDQHNREYAILEIKDSRLHFRYNLNSLRTEERDIWLSAVTVDDGQWHTAKVSRYGSAATLEMDGGEGRRFNESFSFEGHQWLLVDKQEGIYAGGKAEYTGVRTFEVYADYHNGCLDDIRLEGKHLPLPPAMNGTQWGQATMARNLERHCASKKPCANVICPDPFECVDLWNEYECTCGEGRIQSPDLKGCVDKNECLDSPCLHGGTCINQEPRLRYRCICPPGFWGEHCDLVQEGQTLKLSMGALAAILVCLLIILISRRGEISCPLGFRPRGVDCENEDECLSNPCLNGGICRDYSDSRRYACRCPPTHTGMHCELELLQSAVVASTDFIVAVIICVFLLLVLVLVFVVYNRRREAHIKYPGPDDDVRENIINYDDEGGGEDDMTAFDITPLQIPVGGPLPEMGSKIPFPPLGSEPNVGIFIEDHKRRADGDANAPPFDDLRNYAYEGGGSTAGSLSSLASGTDDEQQEFDYLGAWGPRFEKLADMYGQDGETEEDEEEQ